MNGVRRILQEHRQSERRNQDCGERDDDGPSNRINQAECVVAGIVRVSHASMMRAFDVVWQP